MVGYFCFEQVLLISGILQTDKTPETTSYECPLYRYPSRTGSNFIVQLVEILNAQYLVHDYDTFPQDLPTEDPPQKWILRGSMRIVQH